MEMRDHLLRLTETHDPPGWVGLFDTTFKTLQEAHLSKYRRASQTATHLAVAGGDMGAEHSRQLLIALF